MSLMSRLFRVTLPLVCAFLLLVAEGSPTQAQATGSISCENLGGGFLCTMTVPGERISAVIWTVRFPSGYESYRFSGGNQLRVTLGPDSCGDNLRIKGSAHKFVSLTSYEPIANTSIDYTWDCSSITQTTPPQENTGGSQTTPPQENAGGSQTTTTQANAGGSQSIPETTQTATTQEEDEGSQTTTTQEEDEAPTLSNPQVIVELDGIAATPLAIREDAGEPVAVTLAISLRRSSRKDEAVSLAIVSPTQGQDAKLDEDFTATLPETITVPAGSIKTTAQFTLRPIDNTTADGDKALAVQATSPDEHQALINIQIIDDEAASAGEDSATSDSEDSATPDSEDSATPDSDDSATPDSDDSATLDSDEDGSDDTFAFASAVDDQAYTEGTEITALVLPEATGGQGAITYRVFGLPTGLAFDPATRTVSGTPTKATDGAVAVAYLAQDSAGRAIILTFSITVNPPLSFGDLFGAG